jgi:L-amino acid N-acyltransferase YncA
MEPLSERILAIAETEIVGADIFEKWAAEVAALEYRIEVLERENRVLRANVSKSVFRRLEGQGALARYHVTHLTAEQMDADMVTTPGEPDALTKEKP